MKHSIFLAQFKIRGIQYDNNKNKNGTYRLRIYIPEEARSSLGTGKKVIEKRFKLRSEAKKYELDMLNKIDKEIFGGERLSEFETNGDILFSDFFYHVWWKSYKAGQTTSTIKPPTKVTVENTTLVFKKHILPMLKILIKLSQSK